ncbi:AAA family ATPase [Okibacterium fritillariae]|uniref:AAA family ATPase n=1 Tax=Okibacterium fritillariae TaxID=123320 RepID=UPI0040556CEA
MTTYPTSAPTDGQASSATSDIAMTIEEATEVVARVQANVEHVIDGKSAEIRTALVVLLAEGHLLIEDVPGVGKTMLAKALAKSVHSTVSRIQFTPDLLPSDVTGISVYNQVDGRFEFKPGAVFANIVIGDEINRASPKTQSALLECMEERQVTVDGSTYPLPTPFTVVATQNPIEMEGTYALPEAQRDRFMARISMGYPDETAELRMLSSRNEANPLQVLEPVLSTAGLRRVIATVHHVYVAEAVKQYAVHIVRATREHPDIRLGGSPRSTLQLVRAAKALALVSGRDFVLPDDIDALVLPVLGHRVVPTGRALGQHQYADQLVAGILAGIVENTPVPVPGR